MKKISQKELKEKLELHKKWLNNEKGGVRLDLSNADLRNVDLENANLRCADLRRANLINANLEGVDLSYADLKGANLSYANLSYANLENTNLTNADLKRANLKNANLSCANLKGANLSYADLSCASLKGANLSNANLRCANLRSANLKGANLSCADLSCASLKGANLSCIKYNHLTSFLALQCPEEGSFVGYKKCEDKIVKLLITEDSLRSSATSRKCRCSKAKVLSITSLDKKENFSKVASNYDEDFVYEVGKIVEVKDFNKDRWDECTTGIHFFITREEAVNY